MLAFIADTATVYPLLGRPHDSLNASDEWTQAEYLVDYPVYRGANYDASTTNLSYHILSSKPSTAPLEITLSFLTPISPTSTLRQSIPASYLTIYVKGTFDVAVYVDVNGQWVSGLEESQLVWEFDQYYVLKGWSVRRQEEMIFEETDDRAEWGTLHFTGAADIRHESGSAQSLRQGFSRTGTLQNQVDLRFRSVMDDEPVFAFSKSFRLGSDDPSEENAEDSVTFTIAHTQDAVVQYASARGLTYMRPLWKSWFSSERQLLTYHYLDFHNAVNLARNYSNQLAIDAEAYFGGGPDYADILALSARQVMGATSFSGTPENPLIFLKEISSNGNCQTVDVIFPSLPFFLYTSPRWLAYLLEPLLEHQLSGQYPNKYSMHDLGSHFPNMTGHADGQDEYMPVEECGDMLIMVLALVQSLRYEEEGTAGSMWATLGSGDLDADRQSDFVFPLNIPEIRDSIPGLDRRWGGRAKGHHQAGKWLSRTYNLLKQWTSYLIEFSLEPHNQLSTDDFAGWLALHSNLALKGIIGIKAMSELAAIAGYEGDVTYYRNISDVYIRKWQEFAISRDGTHAKLAYDWYGSWTTLYSLYADALLCFHPTLTGSSHRTLTAQHLEPGSPQQPLSDSNASPPDAQLNDFIPHSIYHNQSAFYSQILQRYGLPLDSRHRYAKSDWLFEAAAVMAVPLQREIMGRYAQWVNNTITDRPLTDLFETENEDGGWGGGVRFFARPVVGAHWAGLALERSCGEGMKNKENTRD